MAAQRCSQGRRRGVTMKSVCGVSERCCLFPNYLNKAMSTHVKTTSGTPEAPVLIFTPTARHTATIILSHGLGDSGRGQRSCGVGHVSWPWLSASTCARQVPAGPTSHKALARRCDTSSLFCQRHQVWQ